MTLTPADHGAALAEPVMVAVSGSAGSEFVVRAGKRFAEALGVAWEAVHIEVPGADEGRRAVAAEALGFAARNGATIATVPAASVIDGIEAHVESSLVGHLILGQARGRQRRFWQRSLADKLGARVPGLALHIYPWEGATQPRVTEAARPASVARAPLRSYAYALASVAATLLLAGGLQLFTGTRSLDLLFLFPVIAVAARLGIGPALLAVALSVICYNYFLLVPAFSFDARAPQNLIMALVLVIVAVYTSVVTTQMRGRLRLSDRSARENASIAALAQRLARDSDWETTGLTVCEYVHSLFKLQTMMFREVDGALISAAAVPSTFELGPVDRAALEWAWSEGEEAGAGTAVLAAADWQFQPLKTSLGVLAVLALARDDGRDPVRPDQRILLSTLVAQAALAHERLRLEDSMRTAVR